MRFRHPGKKFWSEYVADGNFVYLQMDQIADGEIPLAEFVTTTLELAIEKNAILIIDIRNNFGGSGGLNRTLDSRLSAETYEDDFSSILLELGDEFAASDQQDIAILAYPVGLYFFPGHENLESALEALSRR